MRIGKYESILRNLVCENYILTDICLGVCVCGLGLNKCLMFL